jgi:UDP-N-acetylmuramyl tripeptide synthase
VRRLAGFIASTSGWLSRRLFRGGGTTLPGVVLLKLRPNAVAEYAADLHHGTMLVSATNGKTTTTRLLAAASRVAGYHLATNAEGSNLERGIATALLKGGKGADLGLFEVDEAALASIAASTRPQVVVLMNLFRDQLDRYGELETLVDKWRDVLDDLEARSDPPTLVLNADDPNIAALGRGRPNVVWFGVDDASHAIGDREHAADATMCRDCGAPLDHRVVLVGHLGHWDCPGCDLTRPTPTVSATRIDLSLQGQDMTLQYPTPAGLPIELAISSPLPGVHNSYNIVAAFAASWALADRTKRPQQAHAVARVVAKTKPAFGRGEVIDVDDKQIQLLLAKNPTGVNQNVRTILRSPGKLHVLVLLNDRTADGQDVSWIWDVDWEPLDSRLASLTLGGDRAWDLALRFQYGGFNMDKVKVSPDPAKALDIALAATFAGHTLCALSTYTAMLDLRWVLTQRGFTPAYWSTDA